MLVRCAGEQAPRQTASWQRTCGTGLTTACLVPQAVDENANPYLPTNAQAAGLDLAVIEADPDLLAEFEEGNMMHSINGYSYCNTPRPVFKQGTRVRWVLLSYGTEVDLHSPLFQNQALTVGGAVGG